MTTLHQQPNTKQSGASLILYFLDNARFGEGLEVKKVKSGRTLRQQVSTDIW